MIKYKLDKHETKLDIILRFLKDPFWYFKLSKGIFKQLYQYILGQAFHLLIGFLKVGKLAQFLIVILFFHGHFCESTSQKKQILLSQEVSCLIFLLCKIQINMKELSREYSLEFPCLSINDLRFFPRFSIL